MPQENQQPLSAHDSPARPSPCAGQEVDLDAAKAWVRYQFAGMSLLLERVVSSLDTFHQACVLVADEITREVAIDSTGHNFPQQISDELARHFLGALHLKGARTLIVEDELASSADQPDDAFYVGDASLRSVAIDEDARSAVLLLRAGSSGYPCNALVCTETEASLGLWVGAALSEDTITRVVESTTGLLTSVWDDESYVALWRSSRGV